MKRVLWSRPLLGCGVVALACGVVVACSSGTQTGSSSGSSNEDSGATEDAAVTADADAAVTTDAASDVTTDAGYPHRYGNSDVGGACEFNRDCKQGLRCECSKGDCACKTGVRGEGGVGAPCTTNEECGSAVCFDDRLCTDECTTNATCKGEIPNCISIIGFSAKICGP
ncbi:MAG: hypothetical protein U0174_13290 [Polyangiaceae bacterium]